MMVLPRSEKQLMIKGNSCTVFCSSSLQHMTVLLKNRIKSRAKKGRLFILFLKIRYFNSFITCSELFFYFDPYGTELGSRLKSLYLWGQVLPNQKHEKLFLVACSYHLMQGSFFTTSLLHIFL